MHATVFHTLVSSHVEISESAGKKQKREEKQAKSTENN